MSVEERYDFVIFGASGFTGQFIVEEIARISTEESITWAVAGRSMEKLQNVLSVAGSKTGQDLESIPIIIAESSSNDSLVQMCKKAKIVLNCVGPYRFHGEQVVKAALEGGASHLDISGEPQYLETVQLKYQNEARKNGLYVVGTCGFDSIPSEMGLVFVEKNFKGTINSVESYLELTSGPDGMAVNTGTFESAVYGFASASELKTLRKSLSPKPLPKPKYKLKPKGACFRNDINGKYTFPFMGSDKSVFYRTQRYKYDVMEERPIQFLPYFVWSESILSVIGMMFFSVLFGVLASFSFGRSLLIKYPSFFTCGLFKSSGPSKKQIETCGFVMTFIAKGWNKKVENLREEPDEAPDKTLMARVTGPEAGYVTTPICMVQAGLTLLKEKDKIPKEGGVYTPGAIFEKTSLIERLIKRNIHFQLLSE